jgi:hypothetical protein
MNVDGASHQVWSEQDKPIVDFPLRGAWAALKSPGHHRYAFDFAALGGTKQRLFSKPWLALLMGRASVVDSYSWDQPVYAPFDGEVVQASDGWPDQVRLHLLCAAVAVLKRSLFHARATPDDLRRFAGNYVVLCSVRVYSLMAHFQCGSLQVRVGEHVDRGQELARVGNSGNSIAPHLHLQVMDDADPFKATIIPFRLRRYERWNRHAWEVVRNEIPKKGEWIRVLPEMVGME